MNEWWSRQLAEAIVSRPGWVVLQFPLLPLGHGAPNDLAEKFSFPGSYGIRASVVHLFGRQIPAAFGAPPSLQDDQARENGLDIHAGASETGHMLFLRPDLVRPIYRDLAPAVMHYRGDAYVALALQILDGLDEATIPRLFSDEQLGDLRPSVEGSLRREQDITRVQREWLEARNIRW